MDDALVALEFQGLQDLNSESSDQPRRNSLEVVLFDEFVEVHTEQFERDQQVLPEDVVV